MVRKLVISLIVVMMTSLNVQAESLFRMSASQNGYTSAPKSLFSGVRAMNIGDTVSILIEESITTQDQMSFESDRTSSTVDNFTTFLKDALKLSFLKDANTYGGSNTVDSNANSSRALTFGNTIAAQVVQLQANGNLVVQGKKTIVSGNERLDLIVSGIVDPRWINQQGQISSSQVSNLQFGLSGRGSISRGQNEGIINRFIRYLF